MFPVDIRNVAYYNLSYPFVYSFCGRGGRFAVSIICLEEIK